MSRLRCCRWPGGSIMMVIGAIGLPDLIMDRSIPLPDENTWGFLKAAAMSA